MNKIGWCKLGSSGELTAVCLAAALVVSGCLGGGGGGGSAVGETTSDPTAAVVPFVPPSPTPAPIPAVPPAIGAFSDPGTPGFTRIATSTAGLAVGDAIQISNSTNPSYNVIINISAIDPGGTFIEVPIAYAGAGGTNPPLSITQILAGGALPAGGNCPTNTTVGTAGVITPNIQASRLSGVAPLAVFFDASQTTATGVAKPFHDLEFSWVFNDNPGAFWSNGSRTATGSTKNEATGPVTAHVFETAGTYQIQLTVTDGTNTVVNDCLQIAVLDPSVVFAGTNTVCLSNTNNFVGCPAGATMIGDDEAAPDFVGAITTYATSGKRVLFRAGETWDAPTQGIVAATGPGIIGSFGGGTARIRATVNASAAILQMSRASTPGLSDWRVMDLEFDGNGHTNRQAINSGGGINQVTLLRLNMHDVHNGLMMDASTLDFAKASNPAHTMWDQWALVDSTTTNILGVSSALSVYASSWRFMLMGNSFNNNGGGEHTVRLPSIVGGVISNNTMQGQGSAAGGKHAFTLRADVHGSPGVEGGHDTQRVVVSDNKFLGTSGSDWTVHYGPQGSVDERIYDVITERNWYVAGGGGTGTQVGLVIAAREQTIRNNLFDTTGGRSHDAILVHDGFTVGSNQVRVYHNTMYSNDVDNDFAGVDVRSNAQNVAVRNNLAYAPTDTQHRMVAFASAPNAIVLESGNSTNAQIGGAGVVDPQFTTTPPTTPGHWKPQGGSYANAGGDATVPVWSDFFRVARPLMNAARGFGAVLP